MYPLLVTDTRNDLFLPAYASRTFDFDPLAARRVVLLRNEAVTAKYTQSRASASHQLQPHLLLTKSPLTCGLQDG